MKKYIILILLMIEFVVCSNVISDANKTNENNTTVKPKSVLIVDLDKKVEDVKGGTNKIIDGPIFLSNDNDEVSFIGDVLEKNSPVKIKIGDNDEVSFSGNEYHVRTLELKDGDRIIIRDRDGKIFVDKVVRTY